jgi:hypothetical protein
MNFVISEIFLKPNSISMAIIIIGIAVPSPYKNGIIKGLELLIESGITVPK